jgi:hypothetical protein
MLQAPMAWELFSIIIWFFLSLLSNVKSLLQIIVRIIFQNYWKITKRALNLLCVLSTGRIFGAGISDF